MDGRAQGTTTPAAYAEDLRPGTSYVLGQHTVTQDEIVGFATTWDPQAFHVDPTQQTHPRFTGVIASGIHSLAILQRLSVETVYSSWRVVAGRALTDVTFLRPVTPGSTLTGTATISSVTIDRPTMGLVRLACTLSSADGTPILTGAAETYVATRASEAGH
jgi:acyl dehydratase